MSNMLRKKYGIEQVALSGGVWQNMTLLIKSIKNLKSADFQVFIHQQVPPNDGGLALGQVVIGQKYLEV
jgi:hydrogenase maturation protein HypF